MYNQSLLKGKFPELMKIVEVIPLYKGKERDLVVNYHPVSLLMTMSKVLEKIVYSRLYGYLEKFEILYESQYGFRLRRSCEQSIAELIGHVLQSQEDNKLSSAIFLDLSKAFDTLNHELLELKLERYGVRGLSLDWFRSYLQGRSLIAKINDTMNRVHYSEAYDVTYGAAQACAWAHCSL